jgi:ribosomal protein L14E/L6E/L27E
MINTSKFLPGQLVISKAGRDHGKMFIVTEVIDEDYVYLVDGDLRKIERPKKKKVKHLLWTDQMSQFVYEKLQKQEKITNPMVRREIEKLNLEKELS